MSFADAFEEVIGLEGGYVNDPHDPGGETRWGISKRAYPDLDIAGLTQERAKQIYRLDYWYPLRLDEVHPRAAREVFEVAVNIGKRPAVKLLQRALNFLGANLTEDGIIGHETITAADFWARRNLPALLKAQNGEQSAYYKRVVAARVRRGDPQPYRFAAGWLRRVDFNEVN